MSGSRLLLLGILSSLGGLATGLYLPAFPEIITEFRTDAAGVHLTLWIYLIGFGVGQIIFGPLSDRFGRRRPLLISATLCLIASVVVAMSPTLAFMAVARVGQAVGAAGGVVIARAIVSDTETGTALARKLNLVASLSMLAPVVAPLLGGFLVTFSTWHMTLWAIVPLVALAVVGVLFLIPETLPAQQRVARVDYGNVLRVFRKPRYASFLLVSSAATAVLFAYVGAAPFIYQNVLGFTAIVFGALYSLNALAMVGLTYLSAILATRGIHPAKTLGVGVMVLITGALTALALPDTALPVILFVTTANHGLITGNAAALALSEVRPIAGSGSAALGGSQFISGGIGSSLVGLDGAESTFPFTLVLAGGAVIGLGAYLSGVFGRPRPLTP